MILVLGEGGSIYVLTRPTVCDMLEGSRGAASPHPPAILGNRAHYLQFNVRSAGSGSYTRRLSPLVIASLAEVVVWAKHKQSCGSKNWKAYLIGEVARTHNERQGCSAVSVPPESPASSGGAPGLRRFQSNTL